MGDKSGQYELHWRGVALANFDGKDWSNLHQRYDLQREPDGEFAVPHFNPGGFPAYGSRAQTASATPSRLIRYHVLLEPIGTNVFFLAPWGRLIAGPYRALSFDAGGAIYDVDNQHPVSEYEAESDIARPSPAQLQAAGNTNPQFATAYLQLPALDPRIPRLAAQITGSASNSYDKAVALEVYLKTHYGYTLKLLGSPVADPLANFLFERKQGHCE